MTEYYFNGRHEYLEEENTDQEDVEDDHRYKLGWSYHKLGFDHTMWKHLSNLSYYYQNEYGFDYHQDEDTDDGTEEDAATEEDYDDSERITRPHGLYLQIKYDHTIFETDDLLYDTIFYTLFVRNEAPWYMYKYFDFRDIQPIDQPHQECAWWKKEYNNNRNETEVKENAKTKIS